MNDQAKPGDLTIARMFETGRVLKVCPGPKPEVIEVWCDYHDEIVILEAQVRPPQIRQPSIAPHKRSFYA